MKELTIEEKVKRYDEAIKKAESLYKAAEPMSGCNVIIETLFPELKESEDEEVRKELINLVKKSYEQGGYALHKWEADEMLAWLEKQGEQNPYSGVSFKYNGHTWGMCARDNGVEILVDGEIKERVFLDNKPQGKSAPEATKEEKVYDRNCVKPANKVEPKFKVGDFIANDYCFGKVIALTDDAYLLDTGQGIPFSCEHNVHLWTIADAKDGDVLSYVTDEEDLWIMVYWSLYEPYEGHVHYHALLINDNFSDKGTCCICIDNLKPATKEQRDTFFTKMKEEGYEWDTEKKKLVKIKNDDDKLREAICE